MTMRDRIRARCRTGTPLAGDPTTSEALRRATTDQTSADRVLTTVADQLSTENPGRPMDAGALLVIAHRAADPDGTSRCALLRAADTARAQAPEILPGDTRADYATRIRLHLAGVHA
jgi:hypothetical protein